MHPLLYAPFMFDDHPSRTPITNKEMLAKIERAVSLVCINCNTSRTCRMLQDRGYVESRPLLECSVVKKAGAF